jgi:dTDP-4-amino-4,6-dideoxygalactose transaminase
MQSAIGRRQLTKLPDWTRIRNSHAAILTAGFAKIPALRLTVPPAEIGHAFYKYYAFVRPGQLAPGWDRDKIMNAVVADGIPCFLGSCSEIYREKAFIDAGYGPAARLPVAQALGETSLMFLVHPTLSEEDMYETVAAVAKVMSGNFARH